MRSATTRGIFGVLAALTLMSGSLGLAQPASAEATPTARVSRGVSAKGQPGCTVDACAYMRVVLRDFAPSASVKIVCRASNGDEAGFYTYTVKTNTSGGATSSRCYYGYAGRTVWVTANGRISNKLVWTAPTTTATITLSKGASAQGRPGCSSTACRYMRVVIQNYTPNKSTRIECWSELDASPFYAYNVTTDGSGNHASEVCYFGYPGKRAWVVVDGKQSNILTW